MKQEKLVEEKLLPHQLNKQISRRRIPASIKSIEQQFGDDAEEELDLRQGRDKSEGITCEVVPSLLADVKAITRKGAATVTEKEESQKCSNF